MYCEWTADILDENECRAATHVFIYTHTPSAADSLRPRDGTQWYLWQWNLWFIKQIIYFSINMYFSSPPPTPGSKNSIFVLLFMSS